MFVFWKIKLRNEAHHYYAMIDQASPELNINHKLQLNHDLTRLR